jgi:hypothetical protein
MKYSATLLIANILALTSHVSAHMEMIYPPPLRSKANPLAKNNVDFDMTSPLDKSGGNYPCKGYLSDLGAAAGGPVATWKPGQTYNMTITGGAAHGGGSCQASLSFDNGKTFQVIHSYVGGCPTSGTSSYDFTVPNDTPAAEIAIFAWTWFNNIGNREMYMNCAVVGITSAIHVQSTDTDEVESAWPQRRATAFGNRPSIFLANINNGCSTTEGSDVNFPDPGPDTETGNSAKAAAPVGQCGQSGGNTGGGDSNTQPSASRSSSIDKSRPTTVKTSKISSNSAPRSTPTLPGGVFITSARTTLTPTSSRVTSATTPAATSRIPSAPGGGDNSATPGNSSGLMPVGLACSSEGQWNCIMGNSFQWCASGKWSVEMQLATGTSCTPGTSNSINMSVTRRGKTLRLRTF